MNISSSDLRGTRWAHLLPVEPLHVRAVDPEFVGQQLNKTESAFRDRLETRKAAGEIASYFSQSVKVSIGEPGKRCWYTPDFNVVMPDKSLRMIEVKGPYIREDARVKFLAAQRIYSMWTWEMWQRSAGKWERIL